MKKSIKKCYENTGLKVVKLSVEVCLASDLHYVNEQYHRFVELFLNNGKTSEENTCKCFVTTN